MELLYENGLVHDISDLYDLQAPQLACLPRLGEKSAENIIRSIRQSVEVPFSRVLFGLGIRFVGEATAKYMAEHFRSLDAVMKASREELVEAEEVGAKIADGILEYFTDAENLRIIERLRQAGLKFEAEERERASDTLDSKSFVISGRFLNHSRDELKNLIELHGGRNLAAVSGNVDYLVAGENMGPAKLKRQKNWVSASFRNRISKRCSAMMVVYRLPLPSRLKKRNNQRFPNRAHFFKKQTIALCYDTNFPA